MKQLMLIASLAVLGGCVIAVNTDDREGKDSWHSVQRDNIRQIEQLALGQPEEVVRARFGKPDFQESFLREGQEFVALYYRTRHVDSDGVTSRDETTPLVFVNEKLVGWGDSALENATAN